MSKYSTLYSLTPEGIEIFKRFIRDETSGHVFQDPDRSLASPLPGTGPFIVKEFKTAKEMARAIVSAFAADDPKDHAPDTGLWSWLTAILVDQIFPRKNGVREPRELYKWFPAAPNDFQKAQRHMVRAPTLLYAAFGDDADHLLCSKPSVGPEIREQLTSQQDMFSRNFQRVARTLYFDDETQALKPGAGSKNAPGVPRRLAAVRKQLDVTWDMTDLSTEKILRLLPGEFDSFR